MTPARLKEVLRHLKLDARKLSSLTGYALPVIAQWVDGVSQMPFDVSWWLESSVRGKSQPAPHKTGKQTTKPGPLRFNREKMLAQLTRVVHRAASISVDDNSILEVPKLVVFGSVLDMNRQSYGDLNVGFDLAYKAGLTRERKAHLMKLHHSKWIPGNARTAVHSTHGVALVKLRIRSLLISLHPIEDVEEFDFPHRVIYQGDDKHWIAFKAEYFADVS